MKWEHDAKAKTAIHFVTAKKQQINKAAWWIFVGFCLGITPYAFHMADVGRGFDATGSEILIPVFPFLMWVVRRSVKERKSQ